MHTERERHKSITKILLMEMKYLSLKLTKHWFIDFGPKIAQQNERERDVRNSYRPK